MKASPPFPILSIGIGPLLISPIPLPHFPHTVRPRTDSSVLFSSSLLLFLFQRRAARGRRVLLEKYTACLALEAADPNKIRLLLPPTPQPPPLCRMGQFLSKPHGFPCDVFSSCPEVLIFASSSSRRQAFVISSCRVVRLISPLIFNLCSFPDTATLEAVSFSPPFLLPSLHPWKHKKDA